MKHWMSLSELVAPIWSHEKSGEGDLRMRAGRLAVETWGHGVAREQPSLLNVAALALRLERLVVHQVTVPAVEMVHATDLHVLPSSAPRLLRGAWILESRHPERPLFGTTAALGGYELEGSIFLVGLEYPDGVRVSRWGPRWTGEEIEKSVVVDRTSPLLEDVEAHEEWAREAARFAVVLGLLLEVEGSPVRARMPPGERKRRRKGQGKRGEWSVRRVDLEAPGGRKAGRSGGRGGGGRKGLLEATVEVRGFLRRQPYGPGGKLRKLVWVAGHEARRWVAPRWIVRVSRWRG